MVRFSPSIEQQKYFIIAKLMIWVWCSSNERTNHLYRLHDKAAELCLANSGNNSVTTTKYYIEYINSIQACVTLSIMWCW